MDLKELLKSFSAEDYKNSIIDLHIHSRHSDGEGLANEILENAKNKNYRLISITDHNTVEAYRTLNDEILISGVEFDCWYCGVFIHLLAYGIDINNENLSKFYSKNKSGTENDILRLFSKRNVPNLIEAIHDAGGIVVLAHPACYWAINIEHFIKKLMKLGLDGIEVYYPYQRFRRIVKFHSAKKIAKISEKYPELIKTGGTDFHGKTF